MHSGTIKTFQHEIINQKIISGKKIRFDIGTSISAPVTRYWFERMNDIFVIGIEPNPDCYDKPNLWEGRTWSILKEFQDHLQSDNYYHILGAADNVDKITEKEFYVFKENVGCSSLLKPKLNSFSKNKLDKLIKVETFPMYFLLDKISYDLIEMVKIDTQGNDLNIIKSFKHHINNVCYLDVEDDCTSSYEGAATRNEILNYVKDFGFSMYDSRDGNLRLKNDKLKIPKNFNNASGNM